MTAPVQSNLSNEVAGRKRQVYYACEASKVVITHMLVRNSSELPAKLTMATYVAGRRDRVICDRLRFDPKTAVDFLLDNVLIFALVRGDSIEGYASREDAIEVTIIGIEIDE